MKRIYCNCTCSNVFQCSVKPLDGKQEAAAAKLAVLVLGLQVECYCMYRWDAQMRCMLVNTSICDDCDPYKSFPQIMSTE